MWSCALLFLRKILCEAFHGIRIHDLPPPEQGAVLPNRGAVAMARLMRFAGQECLPDMVRVSLFENLLCQVEVLYQFVAVIEYFVFLADKFLGVGIGPLRSQWLG